MQFTLITLFPEFFDSPLTCALLSKARQAGIVSFTLVNPRDFTSDRHRTVDGRPYGGGPGMVMMAQPLAGALASVARPGRVLMLSPSGAPLTQAMARELAREESLTLICGRYEGVDERFFQSASVTPVSVGDFVLSGGEAAALCLVEAVSRLLPGFMGHEDSGLEESFSEGLLEYPHYTRPEVWREMSAPEVLTGGDHAKVAAYRRESALTRTLARRPDLLAGARLDEADAKVLRELPRLRLGRNLYVALVHYPVVNKNGETLTTSLTNLDIHDIARVCRSYGLGGYTIVTPLADQRELARRIAGHWTHGPGKAANPDRGDALSLVSTAASVEEAVQAIAGECGRAPRLVATSAKGPGDATPESVRAWLGEGPVLLLLGTASGLSPGTYEKTSGRLRPIRFLDGYNHLSVRTACAVTVDRILGDFL
ncbi:MAG: tRNA (guanosine(37)-N1)-methyltransferase TrmD [Desulfovibrionaceae bacterium]|nr:tRNA (guanosine(37)-N1)-methyltransferase TrmD [Desulfovibrionaceae bacterium]MBF0513410.1 tRNA (guanosine(37)-N1)-methyltransferase TrmD [Desulfovibrionaceae bacterium]